MADETLALHIGLRAVHLPALLHAVSNYMETVSASVADAVTDHSSGGDYQSRLIRAARVIVDGDSWDVWGEKPQIAIPAPYLHVVLHVGSEKEADHLIQRLHLRLPLGTLEQPNFEGVYGALTHVTDYGDARKTWRE